MAMAFLAAPVIAWSADPCTGAGDLRLTNGRIVSFNTKNTIAKDVTVRMAGFAAIRPVRNLKLSPCTKVIDLKGRTVMPGLIDNTTT
jgi:predicted amidohydrolase YtcJ